MFFDVKTVFFHSIISTVIDDIAHNEIADELKTERYVPVNDLHKGSFATKSNNILVKFPKLEEKIYDAFNYVLREIYEYSGDFDFKITSSWGTKTEPGFFSHVHHHSNCWFSAVYYPKKISGGIMFINPHKQTFKISPSPLVETTFSFTPDSDGELVIFPHYIEHQVKRNDDLNDRYSIALNIIPTGSFGMFDSTVTNLSLN